MKTDAAVVFAALGDPVRQLLLDLLSRSPATASQLHPLLGMTRQAAAKHLAILEDAGLVERHREGREVRYAIVAGGVATARARLDALAAAWEGQLADLKRRAEGGRNTT